MACPIDGSCSLYCYYRFRVHHLRLVFPLLGESYASGFSLGGVRTGLDLQAGAICPIFPQAQQRASLNLQFDGTWFDLPQR